MKWITREVKMFKYVFANIDLETGRAFNMREKYLPQPMGQRAIKAECESNNNSVMIHKEEFTVRYALPLEYFVKACEEYAIKVAEGTAPAYNGMDDDESADDTDDGTSDDMDD